MTRLRGWGEKHCRAVNYVSDACFERTFVLVAARLSGVSAQVSFKGALNGDIFGLYVK